MSERESSYPSKQDVYVLAGMVAVAFCAFLGFLYMAKTSHEESVMVTKACTANVIVMATQPECKPHRPRSHKWQDLQEQVQGARKWCADAQADLTICEQYEAKLMKVRVEDFVSD